MVLVQVSTCTEPEKGDPSPVYPLQSHPWVCGHFLERTQVSSGEETKTPCLHLHGASGKSQPLPSDALHAEQFLIRACLSSCFPYSTQSREAHL